MKVCMNATTVKQKENYFSVATNCTEIRIFFLTDYIIRIRTGFDGDFAEESYSLVTTAWEDRMDPFLKDYRKKIQIADAVLEDGTDQAVIQGKELKEVIEKDPFRICVYDKEGTMIHADIVDLAYREDSNHRRIHTSQIEADDCFFGFGEKGGEFNKAQKYMVLSPGDSMGYDPKETDSLYKHIPFYIKLNQTTKKATGSTHTAARVIRRSKKNRLITTIVAEIMAPISSGIKWELAVSSHAQSPIIVLVRSARSFLPKKDNGSFRSFSANVRRRTPLSIYVDKNVALY